MKVKLPFTWREASTTNFNKDKVRREALPYKTKRLKGFISWKSEPDVHAIKQWLTDNEIRIKSLLGVFTVRKADSSVYYDGLAIEFNNDDDMMLFKLKFS